MTEKKTRMKATVEIQFEGYGDKKFFTGMLKEAVKGLHCDWTMAGEAYGMKSGSATIKIKKPSKLIRLEECSS